MGRTKKRNWVDTEVAFYDFIWQQGISLCGKCLNRELWEDFAKGGDKFEKMGAAILRKFPTRKAAEAAFRKFENEQVSEVKDGKGKS